MIRRKSPRAPIPSPDADSPVVRLYREWLALEDRVNDVSITDDERDAIVVSECSPLDERIEAEPALDARDLAIKLYALVEYPEGTLADEIASLIIHGALPAGRARR